MNRFAIVTGATGGMGRVIVERLAPEHALLLVDVHRGPLDALAATLPDARVVVGSIADQATADAIAAVLEGMELGPCVHAAGLSPTMADAQTIVDVNLVGTARLVRTLLPRAGRGSVFVAVASMAGYARDFSELFAVLDDPLGAAIGRLAASLSPAAAYPISKAGVIRLVQREARAWGERGARIVSVSPGLVRTRMGEAERDSSPVVQTTIDAQPIPRLGEPAEIADAVDFLISDRARFITGIDLLVDGGSVAVQRTDPAIARIMRGETGSAG